MSEKLSRWFLRKVKSKGVSDPIEFGASNIAMAGPSGKRRRVDEDLRTSIMHNAMQLNLATTPSAYARATQSLPQGTSKNWIGNHMCEYSTSLKMTFHEVQSLSVAFDASRIGMPKEETLMIAALDTSRDYAGWLAPQVFGRQSLLLRWCCILPVPQESSIFANPS